MSTSNLPAGAWEKVTPKLAEKWLNDHNNENRKLRRGVVEKYAQDMKAGAWMRNPQPIMFFESGHLADGQHRLWAVVESEVTIPFFVVRGVRQDLALNIDTGLGRSLTDNARIAGWERPISHQIIAMAIIVHYGTRTTGRSHSNFQRLELITHYEPHLVWANQHVVKKKFIGNSIVGAAIARAHMHERDLDRLGQLCDILATGMPQNPEHDAAAITLRNYLLEGGARLAHEPRDLFLKTMNAVRYFMRRKSLTVIKGVKDEAYPLASGQKALLP